MTDAAPIYSLLIPSDVTLVSAGGMAALVQFAGSPEALLALAGNLRRLALTIERGERDHG